MRPTMEVSSGSWMAEGPGLEKGERDQKDEKLWMGECPELERWSI